MNDISTHERRRYHGSRSRGESIDLDMAPEPVSIKNKLHLWAKRFANKNQQSRLNNGPLAVETETPKKYAAYRSKIWGAIKEYTKFIGPGFMISVAYMDPGNYSTDVAAGAGFRFDLLFVILLSNCIAVYLQSLAIKLGSVSGRDLAQISREELPRWLNIFLYILAEIAIIATDIAEVVGTAIGLNILLKIPLIAGTLITIVDVLIVLMAYRPGNSMHLVHIFEYGVAALVLGVVVCFAVQLARIPPVPIREVLRGYIPSAGIVKDNALYSACGILGATVMPHSLYLGSAIVKPRLLDYDIKNGNMSTYSEEDIAKDPFIYDRYRPSVSSINHALKFSVIELSVSLFTFALFVNSSILIVAGATIYGTEDADNADLYTIHKTLSTLLSSAAGTIFMLALLFSGQSAGIICTIAGQIVSEGYLNWSISPWIRRLVTRAIAIVPCLIVTAAVGKQGLSATLNASQVALSILLPFLVAPLIYFTCKNSVMTIQAVEDEVSSHSDNNDSTTGIVIDNTGHPEIVESVAQSFTDEKKSTTQVNYRAGPALSKTVSFKNNWSTTIVGVLVWIFIAVLNIYLLVCLGRGVS